MNRHVNFKKQKIKVKLAAQLFSQSIADALTFCQSKLPEFKDCGPTIEFIRIFDDLFNILNSKNMNDYGYKKPLNPGNKDQIFKRLDECKTYISELKNTKGDKILDTRRFTSFLGFLVCIDFLKFLYKHLCEKKNILKFIPTYKFSQDYIELIFGCIRAHNGCNNNPTCSQFKAAFKKISIRAELRPSSTGNCISLEDVSILHVSSSTKQKQDDLSDQLEVDQLCDVLSYIALIEKSETITLSPFAECIVTYIAGFVVFSFYKKLDCDSCLDMLEGDETEESLLITIKTRGGLIYPSEDVVKLCEETGIRALFRHQKSICVRTCNYLFSQCYYEIIAGIKETWKVIPKS